MPGVCTAEDLQHVSSNEVAYLVWKVLPLVDFLVILLGVGPDLQDGAGGHQRCHGLPVVPPEQVHTAEKGLMLLEGPLALVVSDPIICCMDGVWLETNVSQGLVAYTSRYLL